MKILFLDESGDHNLSVIDHSYPLFVLGGVILEKEYAENELICLINNFKNKLFGTHNIILHTADIARNRNGFERLTQPVFREHFYKELNALISKLKFTVIACTIRKDAHLSRYGLAALDPYFLSLDILVEKFCMEIGDITSGGMIIAERRDPILDHELDLAWLNLKIQGTRHIQAKQIEKRIANLSLRTKKENIAGLQLADLVVSPIGRYVLGKPIKEDFKLIKSKFRCDSFGRWMGYGLIVLPKEKSRRPLRSRQLVTQ